MKKKMQSLKTAIRLYINAGQQYSADPSFRKRVNYTKAYLKNQVAENVILYESFYGEQMSGNVYAMFQKLVTMTERNFTHVWAIQNLANFDKREWEHIDNVIFVERESTQYMKYLTSAQYLLNDMIFPEYFIKREEQVYVNTWHGTPLKTLGKDIKGLVREHQNIQSNFLQADYLIASNKYTADILVDAYDIRGIYAGKIIEEGSPRIDATYQTDRTAFLRNVLRKELKIDPDKKIVLYAPTWRGISGESFNITQVLKNIVEQISATLPQTHQLLVKLHPLTYQFIESTPELQAICVPDRIDTNALLSAVDLLITDYSSILFDFYVTKKPIILFAYDYDEYVTQRGLYLDINTLDVDVAFTMDAFLAVLTKATARTEPMHYDAAIAKYAYKNLDGNTTDRYVDIIFNKNEAKYNVYFVKNDKENILICAGGLIGNGITSSLINLTQTLNYDKFNVILVEKAELTYENVRHLQKVNKNVKILYRAGAIDVTNKEFIFYMYSIRKYNEKWVERFNIADIYQREFKRLFGSTRVDVAIDYSGYSPFWTQLLAYSPAPQKIIYLHSHMLEETQRMIGEKQTNEARLAIIFHLYKKFNVLACVGDKSMEVNRETLKDFVSADKFKYIPNNLDAKSIIKKADAFKYENVVVDNQSYALHVNEDKVLVSGFLAPREDNTIFVTVGRLSPEKDQLKLIEAFKKLLLEQPEYQDKVQLYIIGKGWLEAKLQKKITDYGLDEHIILTGHLDNPFPLIKQSNCYISSSNHEGQPMVLLEALVLQKDIIATNIEGNKSVLGNEYGMLVENSIDGLYGAISAYLKDEYTKTKSFDISAYEAKAQQAFENMCLPAGSLKNKQDELREESIR